MRPPDPSFRGATKSDVVQTLPMRTPEDLAAAQELVFQYEGSSFYTSRDGLEQEYLGHRVPKSLEAESMRELTEQRIRSLSASQDWWAGGDLP